MDNSSTGLVTAARARVKTGLVVYLVGLEQLNWLSIFGQFLGPVRGNQSSIRVVLDQPDYLGIECFGIQVASEWQSGIQGFVDHRRFCKKLNNFAKYFLKSTS